MKSFENQFLSADKKSVNESKVRVAVMELLTEQGIGKMEQTVTIGRTKKSACVPYQALEAVHYRFPRQVGRIVAECLNRKGVSSNTPVELCFIAAQYESELLRISLAGLHSALLVDPNLAAKTLGRMLQSRGDLRLRNAREALDILTKLAAEDSNKLGDGARKALGLLRKTSPQAVHQAQRAYDLRLEKENQSLRTGIENRVRRHLISWRGTSRSYVENSLKRLSDQASTGDSQAMDDLLALRIIGPSSLGARLDRSIALALSRQPELAGERCSAMLRLFGRQTSPVIACGALMYDADHPIARQILHLDGNPDREDDLLPERAMQNVFSSKRFLTGQEINELRKISDGSKARFLERLEFDPGSDNEQLKTQLADHLAKCSSLDRNGEVQEPDLRLKTMTILWEGKPGATLFFAGDKVSIVEVRDSAIEARSPGKQQWLDDLHHFLVMQRNGSRKFQDVCQDTVAWNVPGIPLEYLQDHLGLWAVAIVGRPATECTRKDPAIPLAPQPGDMDGPETEIRELDDEDLRMRRIGRRNPLEVTRRTLKPEAVRLAMIDLKDQTMRQRQERVYGRHGVRHPSEIIRQLDNRLRRMSPEQQKAEHEELVSKLLIGALAKKVKKGAPSQKPIRPVIGSTGSKAPRQEYAPPRKRRNAPILRAPVGQQSVDPYLALKAPRRPDDEAWVSLVNQDGPVGLLQMQSLET